MAAARPDPPAEARPDPPAEAEDDAFTGKLWCCCIRIPWPRRRAPASTAEWWERIHEPEDRRPAPNESRWKAALMKLREWSEIVAGPRWKTFIRRFNRTPRYGRTGSTRFQYDPLSYALNFDERPGGEGGGGADDDDGGPPDFSSRWAAPAGLSVDLGGREAPPLFAAGDGR